MFLAIDTSTDLAGVAIIHQGGILAQENWLCRQNQSVELLSRVNKLLQQSGVAIGDVNGTIVALGPGSFNGLRVGLGTAKGLAFGLGVPIAGIGTLSAMAYQYRSEGRPVCAMLPAGRDAIAHAIFQLRGGNWQTLIPESVASPEELSDIICEPTVLVGELPEGVLDDLFIRLGGKAVSPPSPCDTRVGALARLGKERLDRHDADDVASLQPLYLRRPPITLPKNHSENLPQPVSPAVIWDMDGVIVNSGAQHFKAWQAVFSRRGVNFTASDFQRYFGRINRDIIRHFLGTGPGDEEVAGVAQEKEIIYRSLATAESVPLLPGVFTLLDGLHRKHIKQALASSAPRENIDLILKMHGLNRFFQATVSAADVTAGKPDPQVFLIAARRLEAEPVHCVVIEDAVSGVAAGKAAGMKVVAVTTTNPRPNLVLADCVVGSLSEISAADLMRLGSGG